MAKSIMGKTTKSGSVAGNGSIKGLPTQDNPMYKGSNKKVVKKGPSGAGNGSGMTY